MALLLAVIMVVGLMPTLAMADGGGSLETYRTKIDDCAIEANWTAGGRVELIEEGTAWDTFPQLTGERVYQAIADDGYQFEGWTVTLTRDKLIGSGEENVDIEGPFNYRYSLRGDKSSIYDPRNPFIQLNRLATVGEIAGVRLHYRITANFKEAASYPFTIQYEKETDSGYEAVGENLGEDLKAAEGAALSEDAVSALAGADWLNAYKPAEGYLDGKVEAYPTISADGNNVVNVIYEKDPDYVPPTRYKVTITYQYHNSGNNAGAVEVPYLTKASQGKVTANPMVATYLKEDLTGNKVDISEYVPMSFTDDQGVLWELNNKGEGKRQITFNNNQTEKEVTFFYKKAAIEPEWYNRFENLSGAGVEIAYTRDGSTLVSMTGATLTVPDYDAEGTIVFFAKAAENYENLRKAGAGWTENQLGTVTDIENFSEPGQEAAIAAARTAGYTKAFVYNEWGSPEYDLRTFKFDADAKARWINVFENKSDESAVIAYSLNDGPLTVMEQAALELNDLRVGAGGRILFFAKAAEEYTNLQKVEADWSSNQTGTVYEDLDGLNMQGFDNAIAAAKAAGYTQAFTYGEWGEGYELRTFGFRAESAVKWVHTFKNLSDSSVVIGCSVDGGQIQVMTEDLTFSDIQVKNGKTVVFFAKPAEGYINMRALTEEWSDNQAKEYQALSEFNKTEILSGELKARALSQNYTDVFYYTEWKDEDTTRTFKFEAEPDIRWTNTFINLSDGSVKIGYAMNDGQILSMTEKSLSFNNLNVEDGDKLIFFAKAADGYTNIQALTADWSPNQGKTVKPLEENIPELDAELLKSAREAGYAYVFYYSVWGLENGNFGDISERTFKFQAEKSNTPVDPTHGLLTIKKVVKGLSESELRDVVFDVMKDGEPVEFGADVTIKAVSFSADGETFAAEYDFPVELLPGEYTVVEKDPSVTGYRVTAASDPSDGKVTITAGETTTITFTNTYVKEGGQPPVTDGYAFSVEYYNGRTGELLGSSAELAPNAALKAALGKALTKADIDQFLGADWIDAYRPNNYRTGEVTYIMITENAADNIVKVTYTRGSGGGGNTDNNTNDGTDTNTEPGENSNEITEINEPATPLAELPEGAADGDSDTIILDGEVPLGNLPQTGTTAGQTINPLWIMAAWFVLVALGAAKAKAKARTK